MRQTHPNTMAGYGRILMAIMQSLVSFAVLSQLRGSVKHDLGRPTRGHSAKSVMTGDVPICVTARRLTFPEELQEFFRVVIRSSVRKLEHCQQQAGTKTFIVDNSKNQGELVMLKGGCFILFHFWGGSMPTRDKHVDQHVWID